MKLTEVNSILGQLSAEPTAIGVSYIFEATELPGNMGFHVRIKVWRPDTDNGEMGFGYGRWNHFPKEVSESGVVKSAYVCLKLFFEHEVMESFAYRGVKIFSPHKSVQDLAYPEKLVKESVA